MLVDSLISVRVVQGGGLRAPAEFTEHPAVRCQVKVESPRQRLLLRPFDVGQPQHRLTELFPADEFTADGGAEALREQRRGTLLSRSLEAAIDVVTRQYRIVLECAIGSIEKIGSASCRERVCKHV